MSAAKQLREWWAIWAAEDVDDLTHTYEAQEKLMHSIPALIEVIEAAERVREYDVPEVGYSSDAQDALVDAMAEMYRRLEELGDALGGERE
ncbi:MAG: hypothetical protein KatS3mg015_3247 [Fimbriimonadales bacterium]|nr:MAG: hypothetical protein KatS3mg015_3247 [Fimbriimonadales bacterium]